MRQGWDLVLELVADQVVGPVYHNSDAAGRTEVPSPPGETAAPVARVELPPLGQKTFWLLALVYVYAFPYFGELRSANELPRVLTTQEIVDHGTFRLDARMGEIGSVFDIAPVPGHHFYSNKPPGASLLAVPAYVLCKIVGAKSLRATTWAFRITASTIPSLIFLVFFYRLSRRFSPDESGRRMALVAYALASPALPYAVLLMSHQPAAVAAGLSFYAAVKVARREARRPPEAAMAAGFLAGVSVAMDYQAFIAAAAIGIYLFVRSRKRVRNAALFALGAGPPISLLALYHQAAFGSPLKTGYNFSNTIHTQGLLGMVGPSKAAFWNTLLEPSNGLLVLTPWTVFTLVGAACVLASREARARAGAEVVTCLVIFAGYVVFLGSLVPEFGRAGWSVGPRYATVAFPFVAWLAAPGFAAASRWLVTRVLAQAAILSSAVIFVAATTTYPHWPERLHNPLFELVFRLLFHGYAVHSLGTALGLRGLVSLLPLYLLASALALWILAGVRRRLPQTAVACLLAVAIVAGHRSFPLTGSYAEQAWRFVTATWEPRH